MNTAAPVAPPVSLEAFTEQARAAGFDEVLVREWQPGQVVGQHTHPFDVEAWVVRGEVWLTCGGEVRHVQAGQPFQLPRDTPHEERYGPEGATFWAARKHSAA